jgi:hypothetical protein
MTRKPKDMPDPVTDPEAFDAWATELAKETAKSAHKSRVVNNSGIINTGTMINVQNGGGDQR